MLKCVHVLSHCSGSSYPLSAPLPPLQWQGACPGGLVRSPPHAPTLLYPPPNPNFPLPTLPLLTFYAFFQFESSVVLQSNLHPSGGLTTQSCQWAGWNWLRTNFIYLNRIETTKLGAPQPRPTIAEYAHLALFRPCTKGPSRVILQQVVSAEYECSHLAVRVIT